MSWGPLAAPRFEKYSDLRDRLLKALYQKQSLAQLEALLCSVENFCQHNVIAKAEKDSLAALCAVLLEPRRLLPWEDDYKGFMASYRCYQGLVTLCPQLPVERAEALQSIKPLHWAAYHSCPSVCAFLLQQGAELEATDNRNWTALHWAAVFGHVEVCQLLLEWGSKLVDTKDKAGRTALHLASKNGHVEVCVFLLENGAELNAQTGIGLTALDLARENEHKAVIERLKGWKGQASIEG